MQWTSGCFPIGTGSLIRDVQAYRREYLRKGMEIIMKVLWLCNIALPVIARELHLEASNKEGWLSGLAGILQEKREENGIELSVAFPMQGGDFPAGQVIASMACYGFPEDVGHPDKYDQTLEPVLKKIVDKVEPDLVHCFGTEYPHTLAMCRVFPRKERLLVGLQGLCTLYAEAYFADLPKQVIDSVTLRDWLRQDSLRQQQEKFVCRGRQERESIRLAGNVSGRTRWDRESAAEWNERACYYAMNETLRPEFYGPVWEAEGCIPHSIFLSQGDYPVKGLHYMLLAMPAILERYPDAQLYVAGNSLVADGTWKERLKRSAYGRYLRRLMREGSLEGKVVFLGKMSAEQMRDRYLKSSLFVCPSSLENPVSVQMWEGSRVSLPADRTELHIKALSCLGRSRKVQQGQAVEREKAPDRAGEREHTAETGRKRRQENWSALRRVLQERWSRCGTILKNSVFTAKMPEIVRQKPMTASKIISD